MLPTSTINIMNEIFFPKFSNLLPKGDLMTFLKKSFKLDYEKIVSEAKTLKNLDPSIKMRLEEILLDDRGPGTLPLSPHSGGISLISEVKTIEAALKAAPEKIECEEAKNLETCKNREIQIKSEIQANNEENAIDTPSKEVGKENSPPLKQLSASKQFQEGKELLHKDEIKKEEMLFSDHSKKRWWTPDEVCLFI